MKTRMLFALLLAMLFPALSMGQTPATVTLGQATATGMDSGIGNLVIANGVVTGSNPTGYTVQVIGMAGPATPSGNVAFALYADKVPTSATPTTGGDVICAAPAGPATPNKTEFAPNGCPTIAPDTAIWPAAIMDSATEQQGIVPGACVGGGTSVYVTATYPTFPASFGTANIAKNCHAIYIVLVPVGAPLPPVVTLVSIGFRFTCSGGAGLPNAVDLNVGTNNCTLTALQHFSDGTEKDIVASNVTITASLPPPPSGSPGP